MFDTFCYENMFVLAKTGIVGVLLQPFFAFGNGIFWKGAQADPWIQLGINTAGLIAIILWAGAHSLIIFGGLNYFGLLRIDTETEFRGCDVTKHGESAYPINAWKEAQYDQATQTHMMPQLAQGANGAIVSGGVVNNPNVENGGIDNIAMDKLE